MVPYYMQNIIVQSIPTFLLNTSMCPSVRPSVFEEWIISGPGCEKVVGSLLHHYHMYKLCFKGYDVGYLMWLGVAVITWYCKLFGWNMLEHMLGVTQTRYNMIRMNSTLPLIIQCPYEILKVAILGRINSCKHGELFNMCLNHFRKELLWKTVYVSFIP